MYATSREFFEAARDAAIDIAKCTRQLDALEDRALSMSSPSFDAHVSGGTTYDRVGEGVARYVDREAMLHQRIEDDYRLIDAATSVLYGADGTGDGLATLMHPWVADAIYHHYLALQTLEVTACLVGYSARHVSTSVKLAFELMDSNGMVATIEGRGMAES